MAILVTGGAGFIGSHIVERLLREIRELISMLESGLGARARIEYRASAPGDMCATCADLNKAERLLGYRPRVPLAEGIQKFVNWFCKRRNLSNPLNEVASNVGYNDPIRKAA